MFRNERNALPASDFRYFPTFAASLRPLPPIILEGANQTGDIMKKTVLAIALASLPLAADAALWCKNDLGQSLVWGIGQPRPNTDPAVFDIRAGRAVICLANSDLYQSGVRKIKNFAFIDELTPPETQGGQGDGVLYRAGAARFLIDNVGSIFGTNTTRADYDAAQP